VARALARMTRASGSLTLKVSTGMVLKSYHLLSAYLNESAPDPHAHPLHTLSHIFKHALVGEVAAADALMSADLESKLWSDFQYTHVMAQAQAALGRPTEAVRWLTQSTERGLLNYPFLSAHDPLIAKIRGDENLESLLERVRQSWETFEARVSAPPQPSPASTTDPSSGRHP